MKRLVGGLAAALLLCAPARCPADYLVTDLGGLGGRTEAYGLNAVGQVVGWSYLPGNLGHAFLASGGQVKDLGTFGGWYSTATAINNAGQIAGSSQLASTNEHAFLYSGGTMRDLGTLGGPNSWAYGISPTGVVVGQSDLSGSNAYHAFFYSGGTMHDLGTLGGRTSGATGINAAGQVVGWSETVGGRIHAFLYSGGKMTDLGTLSGNAGYATAVGALGQARAQDAVQFGSYATAINDLGQVVGNSLTAAGTFDPFLYSGGKMIDLNNLLAANSPVTFTSAEAINDRGQILVTSSDGRSFLLTPNAAPEPASLTLLALGGAVVAGCAWRRRRVRG